MAKFYDPTFFNYFFFFKTHQVIYNPKQIFASEACGKISTTKLRVFEYSFVSFGRFFVI